MRSSLYCAIARNTGSAATFFIDTDTLHRLNESFALFGLFQTSPLELLSFSLAFLMVLLNIRQSPWAWLFSIASACLYAIVFYDARIYGSMALQFFFIAIAVWGWYQWLFGGRTHHGVQVSRLTSKGMLLAAAAWLCGYVAIFFFLRLFTDSDVAHIDAFLTSGSLVGQFLLSRKKLENWHIWIFADLIYIGLYAQKGLMLTALLFALFVIMAIIGLLAWKKSLDASMNATVAQTTAAAAHAEIASPAAGKSTAP